MFKRRLGLITRNFREITRNSLLSYETQRIPISHDPVLCLHGASAHRALKLQHQDLVQQFDKVAR
jgi:hypothetical protein